MPEDEKGERHARRSLGPGLAGGHWQDTSRHERAWVVLLAGLPVLDATQRHYLGVHVKHVVIAALQFGFACFMADTRQNELVFLC